MEGVRWDISDNGDKGIMARRVQRKQIDVILYRQEWGRLLLC